MVIYCFDLDETLCTTKGEDYRLAEPKVSRILLLRKLYAEGHIIKIFTARGSKTGFDWAELTRAQLESWGAPYHELHLSKPHADLYVDDRAMSDKDFFKDSLN